jgi:hypothetical protein
MGQRYAALTDAHLQFIAAQKLFFVGTATADSYINISPKGMDSLRVLAQNRVLWLNLTGSGNETAAHVQQDPRMTLMFCALEGKPLILRIYGTAHVIHQNDAAWSTLFSLFQPIPGARQIFDLSVELVQTSCGMGVPHYRYQGDRELLTEWATQKGEGGIKRYWEEKNQVSLDGIPTHIVAKNS